MYKSDTDSVRFSEENGRIDSIEKFISYYIEPNEVFFSNIKLPSTILRWNGDSPKTWLTEKLLIFFRSLFFWSS